VAVHMQVSTIGSDLAKNVFQRRGIDAHENRSRSISDTYEPAFWLQALRETLDVPELSWSCILRGAQKRRPNFRLVRAWH